MKHFTNQVKHIHEITDGSTSSTRSDLDDLFEDDDTSDGFGADSVGIAGGDCGAMRMNNQSNLGGLFDGDDPNSGFGEKNNNNNKDLDSMLTECDTSDVNNDFDCISPISAAKMSSSSAFSLSNCSQDSLLYSQSPP